LISIRLYPSLPSLFEALLEAYKSNFLILFSHQIEKESFSNFVGEKEGLFIGNNVKTISEIFENISYSLFMQDFITENNIYVLLKKIIGDINLKYFEAIKQTDGFLMSISRLFYLVFFFNENYREIYKGNNELLEDIEAIYEALKEVLPEYEKDKKLQEFVRKKKYKKIFLVSYKPTPPLLYLLKALKNEVDICIVLLGDNPRNEYIQIFKELLEGETNSSITIIKEEFKADSRFKSKIEVYGFTSKMKEALFIAMKIKEKVCEDNLSFSDFSVVIKSRDYIPLLIRAFEFYDIPYWIYGGYDIASSSVYSFLEALWEFLRHSTPQNLERLFEFSPLIVNLFIKDTEIKNIVKARKIIMDILHTKLKYDENIASYIDTIKKEGNSEKDKERILYMGKLSVFLEELRELKSIDDLKDFLLKYLVINYAGHILLDEKNFYKNLFAFYDSALYKVLDTILSLEETYTLLGKVVSIDEILRDLLDILKTTKYEYKRKPISAVCVYDASLLVYSDTRYIFACGLNYNIYPSPYAKNFIANFIREKRDSFISWHYSETLHYKEEEYVYKLLSLRGIERLIFTYTESISEKEQNIPSLEIMDIKEKKFIDIIDIKDFPKFFSIVEMDEIFGKVNENNIYDGLYDIGGDSIEKRLSLDDDRMKLVRRYFDSRGYFSSSLLIDYFRCPYFFLLSRVLGLEEKKIPLEFIEPYDIGNIYHDILFLLMDKRKLLPSILDENLLKEELKKAVEEYYDEYLDRRIQSGDRSIIFAEKNRVYKTLFNMLSMFKAKVVNPIYRAIKGMEDIKLSKNDIKAILEGEGLRVRWCELELGEKGGMEEEFKNAYKTYPKIYEKDFYLRMDRVDFLRIPLSNKSMINMNIIFDYKTKISFGGGKGASKYFLQAFVYYKGLQDFFKGYNEDTIGKDILGVFFIPIEDIENKYILKYSSEDIIDREEIMRKAIRNFDKERVFLWEEYKVGDEVVLKESGRCRYCSFANYHCFNPNKDMGW